MSLSAKSYLIYSKKTRKSAKVLDDTGSGTKMIPGNDKINLASYNISGEREFKIQYKWKCKAEWKKEQVK